MFYQIDSMLSANFESSAEVVKSVRESDQLMRRPAASLNPSATMTFKAASNFLDAFPAKSQSKYTLQLVVAVSFAPLIWWTVQTLSIPQVGTAPFQRYITHFNR
jgi:hypothetical protein